MRRVVLWGTACNFNAFISNQSIFNCLITAWGIYSIMRMDRAYAFGFCIQLVFLYCFFINRLSSSIQSVQVFRSMQSQKPPAPAAGATTKTEL